MKRGTFPLLALVLTVACREKAVVQSPDTLVVRSPDVAVTSAPSVSNPTLAIDTLEWNMGDDPDEPEKAVDTRFVVHVEQSRHGTLTIRLDTAPSGSVGRSRIFYRADSVRVSDLGTIDRFAQGCKYGSAPWQPRVAVISDTAYERWSRPKYIWLLDTVKVRIRPLPTDSASCFRAGPD